MKILFVCKGVGKDLSNTVVDNQYNALKKYGLKIEKFYVIKGGIYGYFDAFIRLRILLKKKKFDIMHAHYSYSGFLAGLIFKCPVVCSLMGSDVFDQNKIMKFITKYFVKYKWVKVIVKSMEMQKMYSSAIIIPNGVDFENFKPITLKISREKTGFFAQNKHIVFVSTNPDELVKNLSLAQKAVQLLDKKNIKLHVLSNIKFKELPFYYNAADLLLLTSLWEGSPNVIKEAMACNCPIVSTDVGDVKEVIGNTEGCYITSFESEDVADKINKALAFDKRTKGRENIKHLDSNIIAKKIIKMYKNIYYKNGDKNE